MKEYKGCRLAVTSALNGRKFLTSRPCLFSHQELPLVPIEKEAVCGSFRGEKNLLLLKRFVPQTFQPVVYSLYVHATPAAGTAVAQWLRCCATNRKVAGSIPDGVIGIFH